MKKNLSILLTLVMVLTMMLPTLAVAERYEFFDEIESRRAAFSARAA